MNFQMPTDEAIPRAFEQGEAAVLALVHEVAAHVAELARQLAKQGVILQELQARRAKSSRNSSTPPSSDGEGKRMDLKPHQSMSIFTLSKISTLEATTQNRVESAQIAG